VGLPASQSFNSIDLYVPIGFARCPLRHQPRHAASDTPYLGPEVLRVDASPNSNESGASSHRLRIPFRVSPKWVANLRYALSHSHRNVNDAARMHGPHLPRFRPL
jgi:hypothetical protein